ncbi:adenylate kinase [Pyrobaculum sp. 3827-6]|uniref:adenylate kinase n=1 Tax=Pyrobaculum sp. 3827-6 TaxID=2983604 RepID=UPI0021DB44DC|nr:adenylate kinase [Pyrobaculum sp. 3827-6]MCU7788428.1 adenylate kinase [Pyrobaculum sp. 3827-6]
MKIVVVALSGSGKTTIMNILRQRLPDVKIVNYGDVMLEIAKQRFGVQHRDEMRKKIPVEEYRKIQEEAAEYIASLPGDVLIDTHASIKIGGGYYPGLPDRIISKLKPDVILLIEYDPKDILERRKKDPGRFRDVESEEEIEMQQQANRLFAFAAANAGESTVHVLSFRGRPQSRPFEHAEIAADYIANLILKSRQKS